MTTKVRVRVEYEDKQAENIFKYGNIVKDSNGRIVRVEKSVNESIFIGMVLMDQSETSDFGDRLNFPKNDYVKFHGRVAIVIEQE